MTPGSLIRVRYATNAICMFWAMANIPTHATITSRSSLKEFALVSFINLLHSQPKGNPPRSFYVFNCSAAKEKSNLLPHTLERIATVRNHRLNAKRKCRVELRYNRFLRAGREMSVLYNDA